MTTDQGTTGGAELDFNIVVTPTNQSLNPNANVFQSKLPNTSTAVGTQWEDTNEDTTSTSVTSSSDSYQYLNGDINKVNSGTVFSTAPQSPDSSAMSSDYVVNGLSAIATTSTMGTETMAYPVATVVASPATQDARSEASHTDEVQASDGSIPLDQLKAMLTQQLEYYFSRENLANDTYLLSQMDSDQYVPIWTVANFNQIKKLTKDLNLIVEVLRESPNVQVDEAGEKVRPNHKRCIVILREIPESTPVEEVEALFKGEACPKFVSCEFAHNNSWYVTFESDEDAQKAYRYLREEVKTFQGKSIMARIKAKPITRAAYIPKNGFRALDANVYPQQQQQRFMAYPTHVPSIGYSNQQVPAVYAFPPFYPPSVLQAWSPASTPYCDIASVFSINGLAPQAAFKPLNGGGRSNFTTRTNSRHRRKKKEDDPSTFRNRQEPSKSTLSTKETKVLPKFDLEASSFPPLPGTTELSSVESDMLENKMADVVKGNFKPLTRDTKTQTSAPLSPVLLPVTKESSTLTNGDALTSMYSSPPPSPTLSRGARNVTMADKATKTDEFLTNRDDQGSPLVPPPAVDCSVSVPSTFPASRSLSSTSDTLSTVPQSSEMPPNSTLSIKTTANPLQTTMSGIAPNTANVTKPPLANSIPDFKPLKLSYAQMAQRAKEKVEKIAQEQKEKMEVQERERRVRERELAVTTNAPKAGGGPRNMAVKDGRLLRDSTKGPRDKFVNDRDRFRKNRTLKETVEFREERDRRKEREVRPKSPK